MQQVLSRIWSDTSVGGEAAPAAGVLLPEPVFDRRMRLSGEQEH